MPRPRTFEALDVEWVRTRTNSLFATIMDAHQAHSGRILMLILDELKGRRSEQTKWMCKVGPDKLNFSAVALPVDSWAGVKEGLQIGDTGLATLRPNTERLAKHIQTCLRYRMALNRFPLDDGPEGYYEMKIPTAPKSGVFKTSKVFFPKCWFKEVRHEGLRTC